ncbi:MAG: NADH-quinone oxidoreductase subunit NuoH [Phycisphaerales bacterium]
MPSFLTAQLVTSVIVILVMVHLILVGCAYCIWLERKLSAWMQDRCGPNRVGPFGLLQPIADGLKFLLKEDYTPPNVDHGMFTLAPMVMVIPALIGFAVIPWAGSLDLSSLPAGMVSALGLAGESVDIVGAKVNIGIVYLFAVGSLGVYGVALGGWASNNKYSFFGGLRASAQMVTYEIPLGLALLAVILYAGTIQPYTLIQNQMDGSWYLLQMPLAAVLYYICRLAESNRAPFDLAECEQELVGGYHTEYSSMRFALFFLAEYAHMITGAALFTILFLGGWSLNPLPIGPDLPAPSAGGLGIGMILVQVLVVLFKIFLVICADMAIRWTIPRLRYDQIMKLSWTGMIPIALLLLIATSMVVYLGAQPWMWAVSLACVAAVYFGQSLMPRQPDPNNRIPLVGSRFSPARDADVMTAPTDPLALADAPLHGR